MSELDLRGSLEALARALGSESHHLTRRPDLLWQQLTNRLRFDPDLPPAGRVGSRLGDIRRQRLAQGESWLELVAPPLGSGDVSTVATLDAAGPVRGELGSGVLTVLCAAGHAGQLLTGLNDGTIRLIRTSTLTESWRAQDPSGDIVSSVTWLPDGERLVSCGPNGFTLWRREGLEVVHHVVTDTFVHDCAVSPLGDWLVTAGGDGRLRIWDAETLDELASVDAHDQGAYAVAVSPRGDRIVSGGHGALRVWSAPALSEVTELAGHGGYVRACLFSPEARYVVAASSDGTVWRWETGAGDESSGRKLASTTHEVQCVALDGSGEILFYGGEDAAVYAVPLAGTEEPRRVHGHAGAVRCCVVTPEGGVVSGGHDGTVRRSPWGAWDRAGRPAETGHRTAVSCCAVRDDGSLYASGDGLFMGAVNPGSMVRAIDVHETPEVRLWDSGGALTHVLPGHHERISACRFAPGGDSLVTTDEQGLAIVWSTSPVDTVIQARPSIATVGGIEFSPDGRWLVFVDAPGTSLGIFDLWDPVLDLSMSSGTHLVRRREGGYTCCRFAADSSFLLVGTQDGVVQLRRQPWTEVAADTEPGGRGAVTCCAVVPGSSQVVACFRDGTATVLTTPDLHEEGTLRLHDGVVTACRFTRRGTTLMTAGEDGLLRLWAWPGAIEIATLPFDGPVLCADVAATEPRGCAGDTSGALRIFQLAGSG